MEIKETVHVSDLHFDHKLWINELKFFEIQLKWFVEKLEEVVASSSDLLIKAKSEGFQNRIIRQQEVIDELKHKIRVREQGLSQLSDGDTIKKGEMLFADYESEQDEMKTFIKLYQELRDEFMMFVSQSL